MILGPLKKNTFLGLDPQLPASQVPKHWAFQYDSNRIGMLLPPLASLPGFNLNWNNSISMQERILVLILFLISFKRWAFEWYQKEATSTRCVVVIIQMIKSASKCNRNTKYDMLIKCKRASMQTQMREGINANTTNATSKHRTKQTWQAKKEQCVQIPWAKHMPTNESSTAHGVWWGFLFCLWEVVLESKELIGWRGFLFCLWGVYFSEWHAGGAARVHLMLSPVVCGAQEEIIQSHTEVLVPS
jgi:hypothetical protein